MDKFFKLPEKILGRYIGERVKTLYGAEPEVEVSYTDNFDFGDLTTNVAFSLAKVAKKAPVKIAEEIAAGDIPPIFSRADVVKGYINFWFAEKFLSDVAERIIAAPEGWGFVQPDEEPKKIQVEFVSANPTGPLNVVSARAATVGSVLVEALRRLGHSVVAEYYINDAGNQIRLLEESFVARIRQVKGEDVPVPEDGYHGEYLLDYAREYVEAGEPGSPGEWILQRIISEQKRVLERFRTHFDVWFSEREFRKSGKVEQVLRRLEEGGYTYKSGGALWFAASKINPEVDDFVLVKSDGQWAYGLVDIAYHAHKFEERGFDIVYTILGPDHHGHKLRMETAMKALGHEGKLQVLILQQVNLIEGGKRVMMSKRAGKLITMDVLIDEVGVDAARYFFLSRRAEAHLDFDLDLARDTSEENPVYYVQYAHARIRSILRFARNRGFDPDSVGDADLSILTEPEEKLLLRKIVRFPSQIYTTARLMQPHIVPFYLLDLAKTFHNFYTKHRVVTEDSALTAARIKLIRAVAETIKNGLNLCGISAPEQM